MTEMMCGEFDEIVHGYVRMELLDVGLREAALEHTARCVNCANRLAGALILADASHVAGKQLLGEQAPPRVEAAVLAAFRAHHRWAAWRRTIQWSAAAAVAAVLLIFVWTFSVHSNGPSPAAQGNENTSQSNAPQDARNAAPLLPDSAARDVGENAANAPANSVPAVASYAASDFVPVPFSGSIAAEDSGMVVRVQLTRASLAQLGYPVADAPDDDLISADVLVDEDGWPRGVKLVQ